MKEMRRKKRKKLGNLAGYKNAKTNDYLQHI